MEPLDLAPDDLALLPVVDLDFTPVAALTDLARERAESAEDPTWNTEGPVMLDDPDLLPVAFALPTAA